MIVRNSADSDHQSIRALLLAAFPSAEEANLVDQLRADGDATIELVAEDRERIVGHILFSPMTAPFRALALAPLAVASDRQRAGIGAALIAAGHEQARAAGCQAIFVLGDPAFYSRFGFSLDAARPFASPYSGPHFMMLALADDLPRSGEVDHAPAFAAIG